MHARMDGGQPNPPQSRRVVLIRRTASTFGLWVVVALVLASGRAWACLGVAGVLCVLATIEYHRSLADAGVWSFPRFGVALAAGYCGFLYAALVRGGAAGVPAGLDAAAVALALAGAFLLALGRAPRGVESLLAAASLLLGFVYLGVMFGFAVRLMFLGGPEGGELPGLWVALWCVAVTKFSDMGAYIVGTAVGRHKMVPHISPGKTWQGFGGALAFALLAACGLFAALPEHLAVLGGWAQVVGLGALVALLAVLGDLAASVIKRSLEVKDSGGLLPGIGGALDLIDSLCFTAPFLYFYLTWTDR